MLDSITNKLLLNCLHQDRHRFPISELVELNKNEWVELCKAAVEHRVVPVLHKKLLAKRDKLLDSTSTSSPEKKNTLSPTDEAIKTLGIYARQVTRNNLMQYSELQRYLKVLNQEDISVILLKGSWLAQFVYAGKGLREMNDFDLLFRIKDLPIAYKLLTELGYAADTPVHLDTDIKRSHHLPPLLKEGVGMFELHWNITSPGRSYSIMPDMLWERAEPISMDGREVLTLCAEDQLLHLCLHTSYQHMFSFGLRPYYDIAETIRYYGEDLNWQVFSQRAIEYGWDKGIWLSLRMAAKLLGANVPKDVLENLSPQHENSIREIAERQLFTKKSTAASIPLHMIYLIRGKGFRRKMDILKRHIFISREEIARRYSINPATGWFYIYYLKHLYRVIRLHIGVTLRIYFGNKKLNGVVDRKEVLDNWLKG